LPAPLGGQLWGQRKWKERDGTATNREMEQCPGVKLKTTRAI
jgi:hypothetical protein